MRVLLVTYYYPPSGGPGVQRSLKFSRYLPDFDCEPVVLTVRPEDAAWPAVDSSLVAEIPEGVDVHRTAAWDPYGAYAALVGREKDETVGVGFLGESDPTWQQRVGRWLRANVFLPDARVGWVPYGLWKARKLVSERHFDAVLTTGPPHSTHLIGYLLSREFDLPWAADFRDPWTGIDYADLLPMTGVARRIDASIESRMLRSADLVTVVAPSMVRHLREIVAREYHVIPNGFDEADFPQDEIVQTDHFVVSHIGSLNEARNPSALWQALARMNPASTMPELRIELVGKVDPALLADARRHGLERFVHHVPYLEHAGAVRHMMRSALLLLVINRVRGAEGILTGKLFEYIGSGRPVLCIGPESGDAAKVLAQTGAGVTVGYESVEMTSETLRSHYAAWKARTPLAGATADRAGIYTRRYQTGQLAELISSLSGSGGKATGVS